MKRTAHKAFTKEPNSAVLIIDKIGVIGEKLAEEFSKDFYVVLVSGRNLPRHIDKVSFIKFKGKIPKAPKNRYSKIFVIDDGKSITKESSFSFITEAKSIGADFYFLGSVRNFDIKHTDELVKTYDKSKVLVFGDLFDKDFLFDHDASITKFILGASNKKKIKVPGEGLSFSYPIAFEDTIKLILRASYIKIPQKIILLFYKDPITDLSLAHLFQKIDPEIKVDFINEYRDQNFFIPEGSEYAISKYNIKEKIEKLDLESPKKIIGVKKKKKEKKIGVFKSFVFFLMIIIFLIILPALITYSYYFLGENQLKRAASEIQKNDFESALKNTNNAISFFSISKNTSTIVLKQLSLIERENDSIGMITRIEEGITVSNYAKDFLEGAITLESVYEGDSLSPKEDFSKGLELLGNSYSEIQKLNLTTNELSTKYKSISDQIYLSEIFSEVSEVLPEVLGFDSEKKYLILFQDSNELRPGGGKITSVGKMTVKSSRITEFEILDVNELDNKLSVHVEPPFPIRRYLPSENYYLKDSNFNPDFVESGITSSAIYSLETEEELDGVIGVDLYFLKYLLKNIDPVYLKDYGKNITSDNIFQVSAESSDETDSSFTTKLLKQLSLDMNKGKSISPVILAKIIGKSILEKHIMFAFKDPDVQNVFIANNSSGALVDNRSNPENTINDFIGLSEANLGLNKINFFVSRSISRKNIIEKDGSMSSEIVIAFKNSSQRGSSFARSYKNYIQLILPEKVKLEEVSVGGKKQELIPAISDYKVYENNRFVKPEELEIDQTSKEGKSMFGFLISVSPDSVETIKLNYNLPFKVSTDSKSTTNYSLLIYKQPGIDSFPFSLVFDAVDSFLVLPENSYSLEVKKDEKIDAVISKK